MQLSGIITELDLTQKERTVKIHLKDGVKPIWVNPEYQDKVKKLELGQQVSFEVREGRDYYFYQSHEDRVASLEETDGSPISKPPAEQPPISDLAVSEPQLPDNVDDLRQFILVTQEALNIYHTKLNAVNRLNVAQAVRKQTLEDGQKVGAALLWAEAKLGEILASQTSHGGSLKGAKGAPRSLPEGVTHKQSHYAQQLAGHKNLIEETIKDAVEDEDIPTRTTVMRKIKDQEAPEKPEPTPREHWKDCGQFDCPVCKESYRLLHLSEGRHKFEPVEVMEK